MKISSLLSFMLLFAAQVMGQQSASFWTQVEDKNLALPESAVRPFVPNQYTTFQLNYTGIKSYLAQAPREFTQKGYDSPLQIQLPNADGTVETFAITESPLLGEQDYKRYPDVKSYCGYSLDTPGKYVRFCHTILGFNAMIITPERTAYIVEPIAKGQDTYYMMYKTSDFPEEFMPKLPTTFESERGVEELVSKPLAPTTSNTKERGAAELVKLKIYKFACATTREFGIDHGGTAASVLAAMTNYMNQLNALYEYDVDIRLVFVDDVTKIFFYTPFPQNYPYTGTEVTGWMGQNPIAMNSILGSGGYDLGHVFARYMGGSALGVAGGQCCTPLGKGRGCSGGNLPYGVGFLVTVGQEIGHQWAGGHTWNRCSANDQRNAAVAFEPGSGSTIMSYAGACGSDNVSGDADYYYHTGSIDEIRAFVETGLGNLCGTEVATTNHKPEVTLPYQNNFFIPISTPFEVTGSATDVDGDALTYCWEGMDAGPEVPLGEQQGNSALFRTFPPSATGQKRVFPRLTNIIANQVPKADLLPKISRDVKLRLTVRDNKPGGGGVGVADLEFRATDKAGPFLVTSPNSLADIVTNTTCTKVTWNVANTDKSPVNCQKVNIRLSTDGGNTYPITLATDEPNDGVAYVTVPAGTVSTTARLRIDAGDNIFFDISNANFKIVAPTAAAFGLCMTDDYQKICLPESFNTSFSAVGVSGFNSAVTLAVTSGLPQGAVATFSKASINPGETANLKIDLANATTEDTYDIVVTATSGTQTETRNIKLVTISNVFTDMKQLTPVVAATNISQTPTLTWTTVPDADFYEVELATSAAFPPSSVIASKNDLTVGSFSVPILLQKSFIYYWRVRPINDCGAHGWTETGVFVTLNEACTAVEASDLPKNISSGSSNTITSQLFISGGAVSDVNIRKLSIFHEFFKDVKLTLTHPDGTSIVMVEGKCGNSSGNFIFGFDDAAPNAFLCPPGNSGIAYKPLNPLSALNGKPAQGLWKMQVTDNTPGSGGAFQAFEVEVCAAAAANPPVIVNNNPLLIPGGTNAEIPSSLLKAEDPDDPTGSIRFVLMTVPKYGQLELNWLGALKVGSTFTQHDINSGFLRYFHFGSGQQDDFTFIVEDGRGGLVGVPKFIIKPQGVAAFEPNTLEFSISPSPAVDLLTLRFAESIETEVRASILAIDGREMSSFVIPTGAQAKQIQVSTLPAGLYFIQLTNGVQQYNAKFVKE
jgi:subtilisin-like proprotein convertase family protein